MSATKHAAVTVLTRATLGVALFAGCTGTVGRSEGDWTPDRPGSTGGSKPSGGGNTSGGGSATAGVGNQGTTGGPAAKMPGVDPGRVPLHRLTVTQYNNTLADLLGTSLRPGDRFPSDFAGETEFDNNAAHLTVSPLIVALHEAAADELVEEAWKTPEGKKRISSCDPGSGTGCVKEMAAGFGGRAWRRPLVESEIDALAGLFEKVKTAGLDADEAAKTVAKAILLSSKFLYRLELDPEPTATKARPLNGYEVASRLSYFLWNTMPDEALFTAARANKLSSDADLEAQVERMLASPKAEGFARSFGGQLMATAQIEKHDVDKQSFTSWDPALAQAMRREVELFFGNMVEENRPVSELFLARHTYVNARLAKHYGLSAPATEWAKVDTKDSPRGGILGFGGMLTATSLPTRTSVVQRGVYVAEALLCTDFPEAPPDVPALPDGMAAKPTTQRERLEIHRQDPQCNACHQIIDPVGFGLERFDAIGAYRELDEGKPIDDTGLLPGGTAFRGTRELAGVLAKDPRSAACFVERLTSYALGRHMRESDKPYLEGIGGADARSAGFKDLVVRLAASDVFRQRRAAPDKEEGGAP